jgi:predicted nucleic acid-binding protein
LDRLFLDANILFSAAWSEESGLRRFWALRDVELVTSAYALEEARRNLDTESQRLRLGELATGLRLVGEAAGDLDPGLRLRAKDRPILLAAIRSGASHLITGDRRDFGAFFGKRIEGVLVLRPSEYLAKRRR